MRGWKAIVTAAVATLFVALPSAGAAVTIHGSSGATPSPGKGVIVTVEAFSMRDATMAGAVTPIAGRWTMQLGLGVYLVLTVVSDSVHGRTYVAQRQLIRVRGVVHARAVSAAAIGNGVIAVRDMPLEVTPDTGLLPGGHTNSQVELGAFEACRRRGGKVVAGSKAALDGIATEQRLSDDGRTPYKIDVQPVKPDFVIGGKVSLNGTGVVVADVTIRNGRTGGIVKHITARDDVLTFDDLDGFLERIGGQIAGLNCGPKAKPKPKPGGRALGFQIEYSGSYTDDFQDNPAAGETRPAHKVHVDMTWDEVLTERISRTGHVTATPMKLSLIGNVQVDNNPPGGPTGPPLRCSLGPGRKPVKPGGFIDLVPTARPGPSSSVTEFVTFKAWASIPLSGANGVIGYRSGDPGCRSTDLTPYLSRTAGVPLPDAWNTVALAQVAGRWRTPISKSERADFTLNSDQGARDVVSVRARLRVDISGALPRR